MEMAMIDLNILIGVLVSFAVVAYVLVLRRIRSQQDSSHTADSSGANVKTATDVADLTESQKKEKTGSEKPLVECHHYLGYLGSLSRKKDPPEGCLQCNKMTQCMSRKKPRKTGTRRTRTVLIANEEIEAVNR
jgi:hypothetical protein